ncbi:MAG: hypothetical protein ACXU98_09735 [Syntrophales bacterium]
MVRFDGENEINRRLWFAYLYWARNEVRYPASESPKELKALVDEPANRIPDDISASLKTIVFSCFALEYRLRQVLKALNVEYPNKEPFGPFFNKFWSRLSSTIRLDGEGYCKQPNDWGAIESELKSLIKMRNDIAHANYRETIQFFSAFKNPMGRARELYNAVVDAIRIVNQGTGYDTRGENEIAAYFRPLKV